MVNFGPASAENDDDLLSYFHVTKQVKSITDFATDCEPYIYVARQGGGKTALKKWLASCSGATCTIVASNETIRMYFDDDTLTSGDLELLMLAELSTHIISDVAGLNVLTNGLAGEASAFIKERWQSIVGKFFNEKVEGFQILGSGLSLKPSKRQAYLAEIRGSQHVDTALGLLKRICSAQSIILVVDNPETIVGSGIEPTKADAIRVGTLLKVLGKIHSKGVRVTAFIRENILQSVNVHYTDFQHYSDQVEGISWTAEDLCCLLEARVKKRMESNWEHVFAFKKQSLIKNVLPLLLNGPRDLIRLSNLAYRDQDSKIRTSNYTSEFEDYKKQNWTDLNKYYGDSWPQIGQFAKAVILAIIENHGAGMFPASDVDEVFHDLYTDKQSALGSLRKSVPWIDHAKYESPSVAARLFVVGCLGYKHKGIKKYPWHGRDIGDFVQATQYFVSRAFL